MMDTLAGLPKNHHADRSANGAMHEDPHTQGKKIC